MPDSLLNCPFLFLLLNKSELRAVHKGRPQSERKGVCPVRIFCGQGVREDVHSFTIWMFALFGAKNSDLSKFMVCQHGQGERGCASADILQTKGSIFVRTSFMDDPLANISR